MISQYKGLRLPVVCGLRVSRRTPAASLVLPPAMSTEEKVVDVNEKHAVGDSDVDSEANIAVQPGGQALHRTMKNRHIAMIRYVGLLSDTEGSR